MEGRMPSVTDRRDGDGMAPQQRVVGVGVRAVVFSGWTMSDTADMATEFVRSTRLFAGAPYPYAATAPETGLVGILVGIVHVGPAAGMHIPD